MSELNLLEAIFFEALQKRNDYQKITEEKWLQVEVMLHL